MERAVNVKTSAMAGHEKQAMRGSIEGLKGNRDPRFRFWGASAAGMTERKEILHSGRGDAVYSPETGHCFRTVAAPANGSVGLKKAGQSGSGDYQKNVRPTAEKEILIIFSY